MTPWVKRLIAANIGMYFLQITVPGITERLEFIPALMFREPWTILTYQFLHDPSSIQHILFNMIALFFFGPRVESRIGAQRFLTLYLLSGSCGAVLSFFFAPEAAIIGASGAVFGVMAAFARFWPRERFLLFFVIPIEARWLVALTVLFALYSGFGGSQGGVADFAHLGGFAGAWLYLIWLDRTAGAKSFQRKAVAKLPDEKLGNWKKLDPKSVHEVNRDEVNRILDKISNSGLGSLTPAERVFLASFVPPDDRKPVS